MTPVFQKTANDCLSAAVASVLDLPLSEVPVWWDLIGNEWVEAIGEWANSRGLGLCYFDLKNRSEWPALLNCHVIVGGTTKRSSEYLHCVVARAEWTGKTTELHWVHDPYIGGGFIDEPDHMLMFVKSH